MVTISFTLEEIQELLNQTEITLLEYSKFCYATPEEAILKSIYDKIQEAIENAQNT